MLKGIPPELSPDLLHAMMSMGHGDEIVLADGNFPAASIARRLVRLDGLGVAQVLRPMMRLFPLDTYAHDCAVVMQVVPGDDVEPIIWQEYKAILTEAEGRAITLTEVERFAFYERAREAFAIVSTSEAALYANLILKKGVVVPE